MDVSRCHWIIGLLAVGHAVASADEATWRIRGRFVGLDKADPKIGVFDLGGGAEARIPLASLVEEDRAAIERAVQAGPPQPGKPPGDEGTASASARATQRLEHAIDLIRMGSGQLARQELREASKLDGANGAADFVTGLAFVFTSRNFEKAADHFREAFRREPKNAFAAANLAVCEFQEKQYAAAAAHFRAAIELKPDEQAIADNIGLVIQAAGNDRVRLSAKTLSDLNDLYRAALTERQLVPLAPASGRAFFFFGLDGTAVELTAQDGLNKLLAAEVPNPEPEGGE